jgi:hypothetical protein
MAVSVKDAIASSGLHAEVGRYIRHSSATRLAIVTFITCMILMILALIGGEMLRIKGSSLLGLAVLGFGAFLGAIGVFMGFMGVVSLKSELQLFREGPLVPGILVSKKPNVVIGLTYLGDVLPGVSYAITQISPRLTGLDNPARGTHIPCFSDTLAQIKSDRFNMVNIYLIPWGTSDPAEVQQCLDKLGEEPFRILQALIQRGIVPSGDMNKILLDENLHVIGSHPNG